MSSIRPTQLIIKNIGKIADTTIDINKPLILFYGEIKQGKSTILNCVRWVCGGAFPADIIRHGEKEGSIELRFDGGVISRSFYRAKGDEIKARAVVFVRNGKPVDSPVSEIKRLLNPFLIDQDFLRNKSELERRQYFTELFAVDTTALDNELFNSQRDASSLRARISGYGEMDLTAVEPVDTAALREKQREIVDYHAGQKARWRTELKGIQDAHAAKAKIIAEGNRLASIRAQDISKVESDIKKFDFEIGRLERLLEEQKDFKSGSERWLVENLPLASEEIPPAPDTEELNNKLATVADTAEVDAALSMAAANQVRYEQYQANKKRAEQKKADEDKLTALEKRGREIKAEKMAKLKEISASSKIDGLEFDEAGNFIYQGTTAGMISDSQIMRLSSELSALYPEGFGLDLIDRGESLGKSIFEFVDRAKAENKTILATIVGERPAKVPPEVGVFVVTEGKVEA